MLTAHARYRCRYPIQEQGANREAERAAAREETMREVAEKSERVVQQMELICTRAEPEENLEVQPLTRTPVPETCPDLAGSLLVSGRHRLL